MAGVESGPSSMLFACTDFILVDFVEGVKLFGLRALK